MTDEDLRCAQTLQITNATLLLEWDCSPVEYSDVAQQPKVFLRVAMSDCCLV